MHPGTVSDFVTKVVLVCIQEAGMSVCLPHLGGWIDWIPDPQDPNGNLPVLKEGAPKEAQKEYQRFLKLLAEQKKEDELAAKEGRPAINFL